jgi:beta-1,4-N-acetylglucosaminyltransferase
MILATVGTTAFESLIRQMDVLAQRLLGREFFSQIGPGEYEPRFHSFTRFKRNLFDDASVELVIAHCGAGTIYELLERRRPFVAVPNLERADRHQQEIARFLEENHYAPVAWTVEALEPLIARALAGGNEYRQYSKEAFFVADEIRALMLPHKPAASHR